MGTRRQRHTRRRRGGDPLNPIGTANNVRKAVAAKEAADKEREKKAAALAKLRGQKTEGPFKPSSTAEIRATSGIHGKPANEAALHGARRRRSHKRKHTRRRR